MTKVYVPVSVKDELPTSKGYYFCLIDDSPYDDHLFDPGANIGFPPDVTHWLKEVELPTDNTIRQEAAKYPQITASGFVVGAKYILNLLTPNNNEDQQLA